METIQKIEKQSVDTTHFGPAVPVKKKRKERVILTPLQKKSFVKEYDAIPNGNRKTKLAHYNKLLKKYDFSSLDGMYKAASRFKAAFKQIEGASFSTNDVPEGAVLKKHSIDKQAKALSKTNDSINQMIVDRILDRKVDVSISIKEGELKLRF